MKLEQFKAHFPWITLIVLTLIVGLINPNFLRPESLLQLVSDVSTLFIMALGISFVIYIGSIDLSVQSIANIATVLVTLLLPIMGFATVPVAILVGLVFGAIAGLITTRLKVPSFIATLAMGGIAMSLGQYLSGQKALFMDAALRESVFGWLISSTGPIPNEVILAGFLFLIALFVERKVVFGRVLKAIGLGEPAAHASGLKVNTYKIWTFALSGGLAAMAGLVFAVKLSGGSPTIADGLLLPAIVAVLVGGTPLTGGVGGVLNTLIGTLIVAVVRTSMVYLDVPAQAQQILFGIVLIIAIALTIDRHLTGPVK